MPSLSGSTCCPAQRKIIRQAKAGKLDFRAVRQRKTRALRLSPIELRVAFDTAMAMVAAKAGPNYPAPLASVQLMRDCAGLARADALLKEHEAFLQLAGGEVCANLVQIFLNEQFLSGMTKKLLPAATEVKVAAVLGAGIMGGGIVYQSALKGVPIVMKDIARESLELGMAEARKQLDKRLAQGRIDARKMIDILSRIEPTLDYARLGQPDIVVEAVVENAGVKKSVLSELEQKIHENTIIATNTSTISIDELAGGLRRPENFCGMHFFNPVPVMPLVEVIRGAASSDRTIATTVAYAKTLGKTPIIVNNCPGFLVNRILFPYFGAFSALIPRRRRIPPHRPPHGKIRRGPWVRLICSTLLASIPPCIANRSSPTDSRAWHADFRECSRPVIRQRRFRPENRCRFLPL